MFETIVVLTYFYSELTTEKVFLLCYITLYTAKNACILAYVQPWLTLHIRRLRKSIHFHNKNCQISWLHLIVSNYTVFEGVAGACLPERFWNLESLKWEFLRFGEDFKRLPQQLKLIFWIFKLPALQLVRTHF